ncbi:MAG TPA: 6-phosphogluconolactonase [Actinomycetota bacterium]|nr:6-phosphogluconolactonase [Actinomycetota bacterium]
MADLVVTDDPVGTAVTEFLEVAPRVLALGGGSTPRPFYERLATTDYRWSDVDVLFTDERCVALDHPESNAGMIERALLSRLDPPPRVHPMPGSGCDADGHEAALRRAFGTLRLDLAVLGLGADGHTASLFPGDAALDERDRWVARVDRPDHPRITLTLPVLSSARVAMFLVAGEQKRDALRGLLRDEDIPATRVTAGRVVVVADRAAAGPRG